MNRLRMEGSTTIEAARSEVRRIERELDKLLDLILKGGAADKINTKMVQLEHRKAEVERQLADAETPPPLLHPEMATFYREQVSTLHTVAGAFVVKAYEWRQDVLYGPYIRQNDWKK